MELKPKDLEILDIARAHNVGDLPLNLRTNTQRSTKQGFALRSNIYPNDLVNRSHATENYQFAWCPFKDTDFYHDLKDEGYKPVIEAEWVLGRDAWEWYKPEKDKWRWSETTMLVNRDEFLMYRNEDLWNQEQAKRLAITDNSMAGRKEMAVESASRIARDAGVEVEIDDVNGKPTAAGTRRTMNI